MKKIYRYTLTALLGMAILTVTSCKKSFLEVVPKGRQVATTVQDYAQLLNYVTVVNLQGANPQLVMGDDVAAIEPFFGSAPLRYQRLFRWEPTVYLPSEDAPEMSQTMTNIYLFNKVINEVPDATDGTAQEKLAVAAQARTLRAHIFFLMVNYYGKPYNTTTSATDPGFPLVTEADVAQTGFTRASVQEVYNFIVNELVTAIPNLPTVISHREKMSRAAAEAILGRVYVFMGRYSEALEMLNASFTHLSGSAVPMALYDYTLSTAFTPVSIYGPTYPAIPNNTESIFGRQTNHFFDPFSGAGPSQYNAFVLSAKAQRLFSGSDRRLLFTATTADGGGSYPVVDGYTLRRRFGKSQFPSGPLLPDLYLLRAECKARLNDFSGAVTDLQTLRNRRIADATERLVPAAVADEREPLLRFIMEERTREFAFDGYRWFDMRRLSVDPLFSSDAYTHTLYTAAGSVSVTYTLTPERLTLRFPQKVMDMNPGMANNP